jgi:Nuclear pore complex scaffold, nucleoporins 186/192/205
LWPTISSATFLVHTIFLSDVKETIVKIISELLGQLSVSKEMEKLQKNRGLGGPKHQRLIYDIITGTRQTLADTVFCLSAQAGLPQSAIVPLVKHISDIKSVKNQGNAWAQN